MRIGVEEALAWAAVSQKLVSAETSAAEAGDGLDIAAIVDGIGGLGASLNHVPYLSLAARSRQFQPSALAEDQQSPRPRLVRVSGPDAGSLLAPVGRVPALARLAAHTGRDEADRLLAPLATEEVQAIVRWISSAIQSVGKTYPELRKDAPAAMLRPIERGSERALHQEMALQQVLQALVLHGEVVTTLEGGLNTSEGPYRYHLRQRLSPGPLPPVEDCYEAIAERYIHAFAPVTVRDFMAWSGLSDYAARRAVGGIPTPLRAIEVPGVGEDLLAPESFLSRGPLDGPVCCILPWLDHWLQAYVGVERFSPSGVPADLADRDLVLLSLGPDVPANHSLAARIRMVGSARKPRFQPELWRVLAEHEQAALEDGLERISRMFETIR